LIDVKGLSKRAVLRRLVESNMGKNSGGSRMSVTSESLSALLAKPKTQRSMLNKSQVIPLTTTTT
jgi:hypothetical protein